MTQPLRLDGSGVVLAPLDHQHAAQLVQAAADGELWSLEFTIVPGKRTVTDYIDRALDGFAAGNMLPFAISVDDCVVGSTRFWKIDAANRKLEIGHTWMSKSFQGTFVNPAIKYLMLRHAFEVMRCVRVELQTDERNTHSRAAIRKLGAVEEGILRNERILPSGRVRNSVMHSIIDTEWASVKSGLEGRLRAFNVEPTFAFR